jgi:hypothetical protein
MQHNSSGQVFCTSSKVIHDQSIQLDRSILYKQKYELKFQKDDSFFFFYIDIAKCHCKDIEDISHSWTILGAIFELVNMQKKMATIDILPGRIIITCVCFHKW